MTGSTYIDRLDVVATLRSRGLHDRADWVERALPPLIDTAKNAALLRTLGIDNVAAVPSTEPADGGTATEPGPAQSADPDRQPVSG